MRGADVIRGLFGGDDQGLARQVRQGESAALDIGEPQHPCALAEHGSEAFYKGALAASRWPVEPDGQFVTGVNRQTKTSELLEKGRGFGHRRGEEIPERRGLGFGLVVIGNTAQRVVLGAVLPEDPGGYLKSAVVAHQGVLVRIPRLVGHERLGPGHLLYAAPDPRSGLYPLGLGRDQDLINLPEDDLLVNRSPVPVLVAAPLALTVCRRGFLVLEPAVPKCVVGRGLSATLARGCLSFLLVLPPSPPPIQ